MTRSYKRKYDQLRPLKLTTDVAGNADGSVLFEIGRTKVLCTVSLSNTVPPFLRGKNKWWITASYALLPSSTKVRVERESNAKRNERSVEISRLIGRSLRAIVNLNDKNSEKTIHIDCDVIQADGGTRTACITGAFVALCLAEKKWLSNGILEKSIIKDEIAAISGGIYNDKPMLDIDFVEDSNGIADFNFIMTRSGDIIEIQGCAEQRPISWQQVDALRRLAYTGVEHLLSFIDEELKNKTENRLQVSLKELISNASTNSERM